jgi:hypothetical protein
MKVAGDCRSLLRLRDRSEGRRKYSVQRKVVEGGRALEKIERQVRVYLLFTLPKRVFPREKSHRLEKREFEGVHRAQEVR